MTPLLPLVITLSFLNTFSRAQFPTPAPTFQCQDTLLPFAHCINTNNADPQACANCFSAVANSLTSQSTCDDITSLVCSYITSCASVCGGGNCASYMEAYEGCIVGPNCFGSCSSTPTTPATPTAPSSTSVPPATAPTALGTSTPAPSAAATDPCQSEVSAFATCVTNAGQSTTSCGTCITGYTPSTISTCAESESYTCGAMNACPECGPCQVEFTAISNCLSQGSCATITCSTSPSTTTTTASPVAAPVNVPLSSPTLAVMTRPTAAPFGNIGGPTQPTIPSVVNTSSAGRASFCATILAAASGLAFTVFHLVL